ncbi:MAG TPA: 4Fe-4S binding protein [Bacillota bacterium]|nr:4Fe-4S binding protein [Bacillota bacterium]
MSSQKRAVVDPEKCRQEADCQAAKVCTAKAITSEEGEYVYVTNLCVGCGKCVDSCPHCAIKMI